MKAPWKVFEMWVDLIPRSFLESFFLYFLGVLTPNPIASFVGQRSSRYLIGGIHVIHGCPSRISGVTIDLNDAWIWIIYAALLRAARSVVQFTQGWLCQGNRILWASNFQLYVQQMLSKTRSPTVSFNHSWPDRRRNVNCWIIRCWIIKYSKKMGPLWPIRQGLPMLADTDPVAAMRRRLTSQARRYKWV